VLRTTPAPVHLDQVGVECWAALAGWLHRHRDQRVHNGAPLATWRIGQNLVRPHRVGKFSIAEAGKITGLRADGKDGYENVGRGAARDEKGGRLPGVCTGSADAGSPGM
jgi:hypothetical protein